MNSQKELAKFVRALCHVEGSDQEIFGRPDIVRMVCEQMLKIVLNVDVRDIQPPFGTTDHEFHRDALQELAFVKYATRMCLDFGIDFEPMRDLYSHQPDPKRVQYVLSKISSFLTFREREVAAYIKKWGDFMNTYSTLSDRMERLKPEIDSDESGLRAAAERRMQLEMKVQVLQQELARSEADLQPRVESHKALERRFEELRTALESADKQVEDDRQQTIAFQSESAGLRAIVDEPPEKLKEATVQLRHAIDSQKTDLADLDHKVQQLGVRKACLIKIAETLAKCMGKLKALEELRTKYKQAKKASKEKEAECIALENQKDKTEKLVNATRDVKLPGVAEKEEKLLRQRNERQRQFAIDLERAKQQSASMNAEVAQLRNEIAKLTQIIAETQQNTLDAAEKHERDIARAQQAANDLTEQVAAYHEELFAAMTGANALEHC